MHLVETYALNAGGQKIDKPFIYSQYFPLSIDKYITVHFNSKAAKSYDYGQEVVDLLIPILKKEDVRIVQIGAKEDIKLTNCYNTCGQTTVNQVAYILNRSLLHIGVDSFPVHIAGHLRKPTIALYSTNYANCVKPYWYDPATTAILEPDFTEKKPSFSYEESPKVVNQFKPDTIAKKACELLGLKYDSPYKCIYVGANYHLRTIENVPSQVVNVKDFEVESMIERMDLHFDEQKLFQQLSLSQCSIVTNKPINAQLLERGAPRIKELVYIIEKDNDLDFVKGLYNLGLPLVLISYLPDTELNDKKLELMDYGLIISKQTYVPDAIKEIPVENLYFKSNRLLLKDSKIYPGDYALSKGISIDNFIHTPIPVGVSDPLFWKDAEHCAFFVLDKS